MQTFSWCDLGDGEGILEIFVGETTFPTVSIHVVIMCDGGTAAWWEDQDGDPLEIIRVPTA